MFWYYLQCEKCIWNIYYYLSKLQITTKSPIPNNVVKSSWTGMAQIISFPNQFSARCSVLLLTLLYLKTSCPRYRTIRIIQCGIHPYRKKAAFRGWNNPQWRILRNVSTENNIFTESAKSKRYITNQTWKLRWAMRFQLLLQTWFIYNT